MSTDQAEFHYTEKTVATLVKAISLERGRPIHALFSAREWGATEAPQRIKT